MINKIVRCIYNFAAQTETDLEIKIGDILRVTKVINSDWCEGQLNDKKGQFPTAYVESCDDVFDLAVAVRSFSGDQDGDLSFNSGDYIVVTEIVDENWMQGYIQGGSHGLFPRAFIKQISLGDPSLNEGISSDALSENVTSLNDPNLSGDGTPSSETISSEVDKEPKSTWVDVLENFSAMDATELDLFVGTKVQVLCDVDDFWCKGISESGKEGIFPRNFVDLPEIVEEKEVDIVEEKEVDIVENNGADKTQSDIGVDVESTETNIQEMESKEDDNEIQKVIGVTVALFDFLTEEKGDLSFKSGDEVLLLEKINDNWMKGQIEDRIGIFPSNYVKVKEMYPIDVEPNTVDKTTPCDSFEKIQDDTDDDYINVKMLDSEMKSGSSEIKGIDDSISLINKTDVHTDNAQKKDASYENVSISPRISPQPQSSLPQTQIKPPPTKSGKPQRPKLPESKKPIDDVVTPFSYQFKTKSQPLVIIPAKYFKPGSSNIVILKNWKNEKFDKNEPRVNGENIDGD